MHGLFSSDRPKLHRPNTGFSFYPNVTTLRSGVCYRKSVRLVCLSVTFVHPTQGIEAFGNISLLLCNPLTSVQSFTEIVPGEPLRRKRVSKTARAIVHLSKAISHKRYKIRLLVQLMTNRKWHVRNYLG